MSLSAKAGLSAGLAIVGVVVCSLAIEWHHNRVVHDLATAHGADLTVSRPLAHSMTCSVGLADGRVVDARLVAADD